MYACSFPDTWHSLRRIVRKCTVESRVTYRYDDVRTVPIPRNDFEPLNGVCVTDDVVQDTWPVLFDPEMWLRMQDGCADDLAHTKEVRRGGRWPSRWREPCLLQRRTWRSTARRGIVSTFISFSSYVSFYVDSSLPNFILDLALCSSSFLVRSAISVRFRTAEASTVMQVLKS